MVCYGMIWYCTVWYGIVWHGMAVYGKLNVWLNVHGGSRPHPKTNVRLRLAIGYGGKKENLTRAYENYEQCLAQDHLSRHGCHCKYLLCHPGSSLSLSSCEKHELLGCSLLDRCLIVGSTLQRKHCSIRSLDRTSTGFPDREIVIMMI